MLHPILKEVAKLLGLPYLEMLHDRFLYQTRAQKKESWHTDNTYGAKADDCYFGAHYNLNTEYVQSFTCAPGHHSTTPLLEGGEYTPSDATLVQTFERVKQVVPFRPGDILLHFENIPHLAGSSAPPIGTPILRKIGAFRLTKHSSKWMPENDERVRTQSALIYKGGKPPPEYPALYRVNWPDKLQEYAELLIDPMTCSHTYQTGKKRGRSYTFPLSPFPSLSALGKRYKVDEEEVNGLYEVEKL